MFCQTHIAFSQKAKSKQLIIFNVVTVFLGEQILIDPILSGLGQNNGSVEVVIEPLLVDTTTQVIYLAQLHLLDCETKF